MRLIILGFFVVLFGTYCLMKTASDADDEWERMMKEDIHNESK